MENLARISATPALLTNTAEQMEQYGYAGHSYDLATELALEIFEDISQFRRRISLEASCATSPCQACRKPHLSKVIAAITQAKPINFVLPAFPGKSPNLSKVLGPLPDLGEQSALEFLNHFCERISGLYSPGARVILCSDGRVFSDLVGMNEEDVSAYQREIKSIIDEQSLINISSFNLDELYQGHDFTLMRTELMRQFGQPLTLLKEKVRQGGKMNSDAVSTEAHRMYCGITRFLVEDSMHPGQTKSRTAIQKECRKRAYEVILRSNAWSELIAERFPEAVRLSIHPQACGSKKFGLQLMGADSWMTPWHGAAVDTGDRLILLKRTEAEALGAELMYFPDGRPSHFKLASSYV